MSNFADDGNATERPSGLRKLSSWILNKYRRAEMAERSNFGYTVDMNDYPGRLVPTEIVSVTQVLKMMDEFDRYFDGAVDSLSQSNPANPNEPARGGQGTAGA